MTEYQKQFDEKVKAYDSNIRSLPSLTSIIPELDKKRLRSFFRRTSTLLGNVDKGKVRRPAYLVHGNGHLATYAINNLDQIPPHITPPAFVQHVLVPQMEFQRKLEFAIGLPGREFEGFRQQAADEIREHIAGAEVLSKEVTAQREEIGGQVEEVGRGVDTLRARVEESSLIISRAEKFRERLEKLDGDARRSDSLEKLVRSVRSKASDAEEAADQIAPLKSQAEADVAAIRDFMSTSDDLKASIEGIKNDASRILGLASQAGLANSYISERQKLEKMKNIYTGVFYAGIIAMAVVAYLYVLPAFEKFITPVEGQQALDPLQRTLILAIRSAILAPFIWAIVFTSSRFKRIEILEMDYAEKAAASLAYHGYKSEMESDASLLERLKNGLLVRFSEHPERLLRKKPPTTEIEAGNGLFRVFSGSNSEIKTQDADREDHSSSEAKKD